MLIPDDPQFAAAVEAAAREPRARLDADWDRDGRYAHTLSSLSTVVDDLTVERSLVGDLPPETAMIEGYATARLVAHLSGQRAEDPRDIMRMLSPYRPDSPLYQRAQVDIPIRADLGLATPSGVRMLRQFTGAIRRVDLASSARTVEIEALDPAERLRHAVTLPLYAESVDAYYNRTRRPYIAYTNTMWVIDHVLRRNGIYFSSPPRPGCYWAMTGHGSLAPDIGRGTRLLDGRNVNNTAHFITGRYGLAINGGPNIRPRARYVTAGDVFSIVAGTLFEFHVLAGEDNSFPPSVTEARPLSLGANIYRQQDCSVAIHITRTGQILARIYDYESLYTTITGPKISGPAAWHSVGLWMRHDRQADVLTFRWHLDGVQTTTQTFAKLMIGLGAGRRSTVEVDGDLPIQCMQISRAADPPAGWGLAHVPQAELDVGLNWIIGLPDVTNSDSWDVIKQAAGAEYGVVGFQEDGKFSFRNRLTVRAAQAAARGRTVTAVSSLADVKVSTTIDSVRTEITATVTPRLETSKDVVVWQATTVDEFELPPGHAVIERDIRLPRRTKIPTGELSNYSPGNWTDTFPTHGFSVTNLNTGGHLPGNEVSVYIELADNEQDLNIVVVNFSAVPIQLSIGDKPAFRIHGRDINDGSKAGSYWTNPASAQKWGRRVLPLPDNAFRQSLDPISTIAESLLADLADPVPVLAEVPVTGDPRTQLGDVVTINDPDGLGEAITGSVISIRRGFSTSSGLTDTLTLRASPRPTAAR